MNSSKLKNTVIIISILAIASILFLTLLNPISLETSQQNSDYTTKSKEIVNDLYIEILLRPADSQGLEKYSSLLQNGEMTIENIRDVLLNSDEYNSVIQTSEINPLEEYDSASKEIVNDLYIEILLRPADSQGLEKYSSLLQNGEMTKDDIQYLLMNSLERKSMSGIFDTDIVSLIQINDEIDVINKKNNLIKYIWSDNGFPQLKQPTKIDDSVIDMRYNELQNLKNIEKITIEMDYGINSISYLFVSEKSNNHLVIYHQGHSGDFINGIDTIQFFLDEGYSVLAFSMPLLGMNNSPNIQIQNLGSLKFTNHYDFQLLESDDFSPIKYFVEPIAVSLNYVDEKFDYNSYSMVGISGGGWTTILYSAIDNRISDSYSVAGSLPLFLSFISQNHGDYEQTKSDVYQIANYLELYILAAYGDDRKLIQIFNEFDPCCFGGYYYKIYQEEIKLTVSKLNKGHFDIYLDTTHKEHKISEHALDVIIDFMSK